MKRIYLKNNYGIYSADIDVTKNEWKSMLQDNHIFNVSSLNMVIDWYNQPFHQATSKEVMIANSITGRTPYNGIVIGLGKRIIKYLNRFEVIGTDKKSRTYFIIPFEGWYFNYKQSNDFVWKVRDELI
ncbi:MAG: hypothetical protein Q4B48_08435, partial [Syntrophomonadaceae bacterium]|nr:hypothetical protein [Syntrophomonadaceae bacterium]